MSKISTYEVVPVPKLADKLIGTSVGGEIEDVTYNFTLQELLTLFIPYIPANNLQGVLDFGNTATQDINLFGTITTTNLDVTDTANLFITYLNEEAHIVGGLFDSADSIGLAGQVLTSTGEFVEWVTLPPIFTPNLQQVLEIGNTADIDIVLDANIEALDVNTNTATINTNIIIDGTITDEDAAVGAVGNVLSSTATGVKWVPLPVYSATSPLLFNSATGVFSIQQATNFQDGYLSSSDWITFNGKQNAGNYITALTGEVTASGPGSATATVGNAAVIGKVLTGFNPTAGTINASDSILTAFGKTQSQINALVGGVQYQGVWNASTNVPTLTSSVGVQGHYYVVNVAGTTNLNGITDWQIGDWAIFSESTWQKVDNSESVSSVNGFTGAVSLTTDNIPEGSTNLYFLNSRARLALSATSPLGYDNSTGVFSIQQASGSQNGYLSSTDWTTFNNKQNYLGGTGLVKSSAGTISYITDNSANWNTAYNDSIISAAVTGTTSKTLTLTQQDAGTITASWTDLGLTSVGVSMPSAFNVANSPLTADGTIAITGAGVASQYIRGDGSLANFPTNGGGGGGSVSYYLNGSVNQGTFGGNTYYEMSKIPIIGTGTDFSINANGYISQFITDVGDPALLNIPAGNWNLEMYFSASSGGGSPSFYVELYKYDGVVFTLIASSSATPEGITNGTAIDLYTTAVAVPATALTITDRLAIRVYVNHSGRTITLHTESSHLCQVITTFSTGITALNGLTTQVQYLATGTSGTDFNILSLTDTHTFNLPVASAANTGKLSSTDWSTFNSKGNGTVTSVAALTLGTTGTDLSSSVANSTTTPVITLNVPTASATNRGALSSADWTTFNNKQGTLTLTTTGTSGAATLVGDTLNIPQYSGGGGGGMAIGGSITSATAGSVLFAGASGVLAQDNAQFFWDDTNNRLGLGTSSPSYKLSVQGPALGTAISWTDAANNTGYLSIRSAAAAIGADNNLVFETASTERMRINSTGNVGIGSTNPTNRLVIRGSGDQHVEQTSTTAANAYTIYNNSSKQYIVGLSKDITTNSYIIYDGTLSATRMIITSAGDIGINTTTIGGSKFQVNGSAAIGYSASTAAPTNGLAVAGQSTFGTDTFTTTFNASFGTISIQSYSVNNAWFGDNVFYNGTNFIRRSTGFAGMFYFLGSEGQFRFGATGAAGGSIGTGVVTLKTNLDNSFAVGNLSASTGVYTGATFLVNSSGSVGVGTITIGSKLQVNGNAAIGYSASTAAPTNGLAVSGSVGIGTTSGTNKLTISSATNGNVFLIDGLGGGTPNFIMQGNGEQTFRFYNNAATGSGRVSWKLANRNNTDWQWILFNDIAGTGENSFTIQNITNGHLFSINTSGNIGLATTTIGSRLQVNGNAAIGYSASTAAPINGLAVAGQVGIGFTSTLFALQVKSNSGTPSQAVQFCTTDWTTTVGSALQFGFGTPTGNTYSEIRALSSGYNAFNNLVLQSLGGRVAVGTTTIGSTFQVGGNVAIGYTASTAAPTNGLAVSGLTTFGNNIELSNGTIFVSAGSGLSYSSRLSTAYNFPYVDTYLDSFGGTSYEGRLNFRTNSEGGAMSTKMTILNNGNVGIGTATPTNLLHLVAAAPILAIESNTTGNVFLRMQQSGTVVSSMFYNNATSTLTISNNNSGIQFNTSGLSNAMNITSAGIVNTASRVNVNGAGDNSLFSLNNNGTLYTVGFSPTATATASTTLTITTAQTTWIYNGTGAATWTLPNPSGTNQMYWIKNAGTGTITLNAFSGTNIINNSAASVTSITIAVGATVLIQQDGNVKSYQLQ